MKLFCSKCSKEFPVTPGDSAEVNCPVCGQAVVRPDYELGPGVVIGDFLIEKKISTGGMGEVFQARQISLDRPVALKVLLTKYTNDREYIASLFREARAAAKISHPNIVQAYAVGQDNGVFYFAMELIRGDTLKNIMRKEGALPADKAAEIIRDIANALDVAWREQKLVHQDIKPDNIMVDVNGFAKLADLGLAKTGAMESTSDEDSDEVLGTPQYISPEQLTGVPTDIRSDIYSLGATFYHIVTGKLPYRATDLEELARMHDAGNLTPPKNIKPELPDELNRIIVRMMARNIDDRYQSAAELVADLERFLVAEKANAIDEIKLSSFKPVPKAVDDTPAPAPVPRPVAPRPAAPAAPRPASPAAPRPAAPASPRPASPAAPSPASPGAPRPAGPGAPRPAGPGAPRPAGPGASRPAVPGVAASSDDAGESFWQKNRKSLILLIILALVGGGILASRFLGGDDTAASGAGSEAAESADSGEGTADDPATAAENGSGSSTAEEPSGDSETTEEQDNSEEEARLARIAGYKRDYAGLKDQSRSDNDGDQDDDDTPEFTAAPATFQRYEKPDLSRPEYLALAREIISWREANPTKDAEFLQKVDNAWYQLRYPQTPAEYELLSRLMNMYSALDEEMRCKSARSQAREVHERVIAEARQRQEEVRQEAARLQEQRRLQQQEQARQAAENARIRAEAERQRQERENSVQNQVNHYLGICMTALYRSAFSGDMSALTEAINQATIFTDTVRTFSDAERKKITDFKALLATLPNECTKLKSFFDRFRNIRERRGVRIIVGRITVLLLQIKPGELVYRDREGEARTVAYKDMEERTRITLMRSFERLGIENYEFYSDLFHGQLPADSVVPDGFWKNVWPVAKTTILQQQ